MKIRMRVSCATRVDGVATSFGQGTEHDVDDALGQAFVKAQLADAAEADEPDPEPEPEPDPEPEPESEPKRKPVKKAASKSRGPAPENK